MKFRFLYSLMALLVVLLISGCSTKQDEENSAPSDNYGKTREVAWKYLHEKSWGERAFEDWRSAEVIKTIADNSYKLLDKIYAGQEVLRVSFVDKENVVVGTPLILVDPNTNKVIGYMTGE